MNKKNMLKIWFDKTFRKVVKVDNIDKINELLNEKQKVLKDLNESYYESKGELKTLQDKIKEYDKVISDMISAKNKILNKYTSPEEINEKDNENIKKLALRYKDILAERNLLKSNEESLIKITDNLKKMVNDCDRTISDLKSKAKQLEIKDKYANKVNKFIDVVDKNSNLSEFNDIKDKIDTSFNSAEFKLDDYNSEVDFKNIIHDAEDESIINEFMNL